MKLTILSDKTFELTPAMLLRIGEFGCDVDYLPADTASAARLSGSEIIFGCPPTEALRELPELKWHHLPNAAIQPYVSPELYANSNVVLTNSSGVYGEIIAEHVAAQVLAMARLFPLYARRQHEQLWKREDYGCVRVEGSTAAVFGLGDLGLNAAKKLKALGVNILGVRRTLFDKPPCVDELYDLRSTKEVLSRADFVICCLPWTKQTENIFNTETLAEMKKSAYFINVGRGITANTEALVAALQSGAIAGAALDVTDPEPLPKDHPLWTMDNVLLTPHSACVSDDIQERKVSLFINLLARHKNNRTLPNRINFRNGY
ncbi:dehydrogenase [Clostridia bacterium]|nr:dehydrogenase [Clostridia bacterium]